MRLLDYLVLAMTVAGILIVGYRSSAKGGDTEGFLTANHSLNRIQAGFSLAATDIGGSAIIATVGYCYTVGLAGVWWDMAAVPAFLLVGLFLAKRFNQLGGNTVPGFLSRRYSPGTGRFAALMHLCSYMAALSAQFTISCVMLQSLTGVDTRLSLIISMVLVVALTSGGLKTVVNTDAFLFGIIILSLVCCVAFILRGTGGMEEITAQLPEGFLSLGAIGVKQPLSWAFLCFLSYSTSQGYIQRMSAAKDEKTAQFSAFFTAGFYLFISLLLGLVGIAAYKVMPGIEDTNTVYPLVLMKYMPQGLLGLSVAGIFAATISTATSLLHAMTTIFVKDILPEGKGSYVWTKGSVVVFALASLVISLFSSNIINVLYVSGLFYSTSVFLPMALGMKWEWFTARAAFLSMAGTVCLSLLWEKYALQLPGFLGMIPSNAAGIIISGVLMTAVTCVDRGVVGARK